MSRPGRLSQRGGISGQSPSPFLKNETLCAEGMSHCVQSTPPDAHRPVAGPASCCYIGGSSSA
jgi:hypothetical protein